jgi:hypothetical protein
MPLCSMILMRLLSLSPKDIILASSVQVLYLYIYFLIILMCYWVCEGEIVSRANISYGFCIYVSVCFKDVEQNLRLIDMF